MLVARGGSIIFHSNPLIMEDENITTIFDLPSGEYLAESFRERINFANFYDEQLGDSYFVSARLPTVAWTLLDVIPAYAVQTPITQSLTIIMLPIGILGIAMYVFGVVLFNIIARSRTKEEKIAFERDMAEESNKAKSRFLARMSHELRTPITAVLGISEIEMQNPDLPPKTEESFVKIQTSANRLLSIVNDVLDLSKIESSKLKLYNEEYEVKNLISNVTQLQPGYQKNKKIDFILKVDESLPVHLMGDLIHIEQIVSNLLSNAFKYTESGVVELSWTHLPHESKEGYVNLAITISDTGCGMTAEQISTLGQGEYLRFHEDENKYVSGTGLGMSIVHNLLTLMDGTKTIESTVGTGTVIKVTIPQKLTGDSSVLGKEVAVKLQQCENYLSVVGSNLTLTAEPMPHGRVLIVDDQEINLLVISGLLAPYQLQVETCESGSEAIEKVKQGNVYDIIFMDIMMPVLDGVETMKILRDIGYTHPIVAQTANALIGQAEKLTKAGFDDFLSKPIQTKSLNVIVQKYVSDKEA